MTQVDDGKVYVGVASGGGYSRESWTDGDDGFKTDHVIVNTFTASAVFTTPGNVSEAQKAALAGKSYDVTVTAAGNAVLVQSDGKTAKTTKVTVAFNASGNIASATVTDGAYFAIRTNNPTGLEYLSSAGNGQVISTTDISASTDSDVAYVGAAFYNNSTKAITKCTVAADGENAGTWAASGTYMHEADKLVIAAQDNISENS